jgi:hypothetical protein
MKVKLLLFGEGLSIPKTEIGIGVGFVSVWMNGNGFESAANQIGSLGVIFIETPEIDIGDLDDERQQIFTDLHGRTITFDLKPTVFARNGGICRIAMTASIQHGGNVVDKKIEFVAQDCTGLSIVSNPLNFSCDMFQMDKRLSDFPYGQVVSDEEVASIADSAPGFDTDEINA